MAVLDTNSKGDVTTAITLTIETVLTLYASILDGAHGICRVGIETSPDGGTTWIEHSQVLAHAGQMTYIVAATKARIKVIEAQGGSSRFNVWLIAR